MKIPNNLIDFIRSMVDNETQFFNIEWHNDNYVMLNTRKCDGNHVHRYEFLINEDGTVDEVALTLTLHDRRDTEFWYDIGYPTQGSAAYIKLDSIENILGSSQLIVSSVAADQRLVNRIHCTYDNGMLTIEVATKPNMNTQITVRFARKEQSK